MADNLCLFYRGLILHVHPPHSPDPRDAYLQQLLSDHDTFNLETLVTRPWVERPLSFLNPLPGSQPSPPPSTLSSQKWGSCESELVPVLYSRQLFLFCKVNILPL